jgi:hypothetical protein
LGNIFAGRFARHQDGWNTERLGCTHNLEATSIRKVVVCHDDRKLARQRLESAAHALGCNDLKTLDAEDLGQGRSQDFVIFDD